MSQDRTLSFAPPLKYDHISSVYLHLLFHQIQRVQSGSVHNHINALSLIGKRTDLTIYPLLNE